MTGEQRPGTTSRITDALLPPPAPDTEPSAMETTTRLRAIHPTELRPTTPPHPASGSAAPTRPIPGAGAVTPPVPPRPTAASPASTPATPDPGPVAPARPVSGPGTPPRPTTLPSAPPRPASAPGAPAPPPPAPRPLPAPGPSSSGRAHGFGAPGAPLSLPPEAPVETTTRLRPVRERRAGRAVAVAACAVFGTGLIGGALAGVWLAAAESEKPAEPAGYTEAMELWHNAPVDTLFPRTLSGPGAGPGAATRTWTRIVVAPDAACSPAVLAQNLLAALRPLGCERVLRATYTDATASGVITVGLVFTRADAATQRTLDPGLTTRMGQDVPPALAGPGTVAARFGAKQRAGWWLNAPADLPVVVTAVSGFADGRAVDGPQPADRAMARGRTDAVAQSGLGHEAKNITVLFEQLLRTAVAPKTREKDAR
ncbi:hypothetical protein ACGFZH_26720 [Streptomyces zaomyceticus]|uniref:hypothetical protein n=1 Tax=Streptomyces zaomyceticus TaxID=68286 RepID=UPI00371B8C40